MWALDNRTPFAADSGWIRDINGAEVWVVAVKASYDIQPDGTTRVAAEQTPVFSGPIPHENSHSLRYDTDLGPPKPATDILVNGHAYAQDSQPVAELLAGFRIGPITRLAKISGDRYWQHGTQPDSPSEATPFLRMPLIAERAFGGRALDTEHGNNNPLGRGIHPDAEGYVWLPNIEAFDQLISSPSDAPAPFCVGPIPSHWPQRSQYAGTYDEAWFEHRRPLPPQDVDARHWQLAPEAQQVIGHLRGGEEVILVNLTPPDFVANGRLAFRLPKLSLAFQTYFLDGSMITSRAVIHSVILEPDYPRVSIVHHMALPCHDRVNRLDKTRILQKQRPLDLPPKPVAPHLDWPIGDADARADS